MRISMRAYDGRRHAAFVKGCDLGSKKGMV